MRNKKRIIISLIAAMLLACPAVAQDDDNENIEQPTESAKKTALSREEMVREIEDEIALFSDILESIPELKRRLGVNGSKSYAYFDGKKDVDLNALDEKMLAELFNRVETKAASLRQDFNIRELEIGEEARNLPKQPPLLPPRLPPQPPRRVN